MTGVGGAPKDFQAFVTWTKKKITALERAPRGGGSEFVLPDRLSPTGQQVTNWQDVTEDGFYWSDASATGGPFTGIPFVGYAQNNPTADRMIIRLSVPFGNSYGDTEWVRVRSGVTWFNWRRADGKVMFPTVTATTKNFQNGRYDLNGTTNSWFFAGAFNASGNGIYRAFRISYQVFSPTVHRPIFRFLSTGTTQISTADYVSSYWDPSGHTTPTETVFYTAKTDAVGHVGEFLVTSPAQITAPKRIVGHTFSTPGSQTNFGGSLVNYDTTAMEGFLFFLSASATITPDSDSWISIQGVA